MEEELKKLDLDVVKALLLIAKMYVVQDSCANCPLHSLCGKMPLDW